MDHKSNIYIYTVSQRNYGPLTENDNRKWYITYQIEAITMTLTYLQGHSNWKAFTRDFYPRDATP